MSQGCSHIFRFVGSDCYTSPKALFVFDMQMARRTLRQRYVLHRAAVCSLWGRHHTLSSRRSRARRGPAPFTAPTFRAAPTVRTDGGVSGSPSEYAFKYQREGHRHVHGACNDNCMHARRPWPVYVITLDAPNHIIFRWWPIHSAAIRCLMACGVYPYTKQNFFSIDSFGCAHSNGCPQPPVVLKVIELFS